MFTGGVVGRLALRAPLVFLSEAFKATKRYQQLRVGIELLKARIIRIIKIAWRQGKSESMLSSTKAYHRRISPLNCFARITLERMSSRSCVDGVAAFGRAWTQATGSKRE
jgi:hypothetical protein